jgi:uncharacterized membrane protein YfhO
MDSYAPNDLVYPNLRKKCGVFPEIFYQPGWDAFIDGKKRNTSMQLYSSGMKVPAGEHQIEFKFEPKSYFMGESGLCQFGTLDSSFFDWWISYVPQAITAGEISPTQRITRFKKFV